MEEFKECEESFKKEQEYLHREDIVSEEICIKFFDDHVKPVIEHPDTQKFLDEKTGSTVYVNVESKKIVEAADTGQPGVKDFVTAYPTNEKYLELLERQGKITLPIPSSEEL